MGADRHGFNGHNYRKIKAAQRAKGLPCWLCGQPINYHAADPNADDAFSYDHYKPWEQYPALRYDPDNGRSAHQLCNKQRQTGQRAAALDIGAASELW